jgi:hypothetical protein
MNARWSMCQGSYAQLEVCKADIGSGTYSGIAQSQLEDCNLLPVGATLLI